MVGCAESSASTIACRLAVALAAAPGGRRGATKRRVTKGEDGVRSHRPADARRRVGKSRPHVKGRPRRA
jgi:hypothetical protein